MTTEVTTKERVIELLRVMPAISRRGICEELGRSTTTIKYQLKNLEASGRITREACGCCGAEIWRVNDGF